VIDITSFSNGDLTLIDTEVAKAANVLQVQLGELEYVPTFGIDLKFFLSEEFQFQNESFKSYLIQRLSEHHVSVNQVVETIETFFRKLTFTVGAEESQTGGMIR
jgi:hypothetical protein